MKGQDYYTVYLFPSTTFYTEKNSVFEIAGYNCTFKSSKFPSFTGGTPLFTG